MTHALTAAEAAAEIHALINRSPHSPHRHEIEAVIARVGRQPVGSIAHLRDEWWTLVVQASQASTNADVPDSAPHAAELQAGSAAADQRLLDFERMIWRTPARSLADLTLLADMYTEQLWPGCTLTMGSLPDCESLVDALLQSGPDCEGGICDEARAALLKAIMDVGGAP